MRKKLIVHRKAFCRKPFVRASGVHVSASCSPSTSFSITDRGAVGRGKKLFEIKKGKLTRFGYSTHLPARQRRMALRMAENEYGATSVFRMLNAQVVLRKRTGGARQFKSDRDWVRQDMLGRTI